MPFKSEKQRKWMHANKPKMAKKWEKKKENVEEKKERDYKDEYKKFQSSTKAKKYRAELNKYNRKKGTYGNGDGKDASHKGGKLVGFEAQSKNRGRAEKSRLKKESTLNENPAVIATAARMAIQNAQGKKVSVNTARQSKYASKDPSTHKKAKSIFQRIKDKFTKKKDDKPKKKSTPTTAADFRRSRKENVNEAMSESQRFKVYNSLKKGDIVSIKYDSSIQKGTKYIPYVVTKGKTKLMKGKIERIILKSPKNPRFKAYLYNRDGDVSLALGDMAASIVDMKKGKVKESVDERLKKGQKIIAVNPKDKTLKGKDGVIYDVGIGNSTSYVVQVGKGKKTRFSIMTDKEIKLKESVDERKFNHKKVGDDYMGGVNSPKGDTEMFSDKKGKYYIWVKPKGKKAKYIDLPKRIKNRSDADNFHDKIKKSMGESVNERIPAGEQKLVYQFKKLSTSQMDELDAMFARAGINGVPDFNKKTWSTYANRDAMKLKKNKTLQKFIKLKGGQQIKEGFGGELKGSEKKKFENDRKKNGEQLGYTLTGESDVKETLRRVVKEEVSNIISERMDKRQAGETLKQLGGNKFIAMTGAKNFAVGPKGMGFKIGRNSKSINYVRIDLKSNDLYDMEFIRLRKSQIKVVKRVTGVYNDQLQKMFTKYTGMYTSL